MDNLLYFMDEYVREINTNVKSLLLFDFENNKEAKLFLEKNRDRKNLTVIGTKKSDLKYMENYKVLVVTNSGNLKFLDSIKNRRFLVQYCKIKNHKVSNTCTLYRSHPSILYSLNFITFLQNTEIFIDTYFDKQTDEKPILLLSKYDINRIKKDIEYLKESAILTARLAAFLYKLCTLDFWISDTKIGKHFSNSFNRSKVYNDKQFEIKNTKGYLVPIMINYKTRKTIATKLMQYSKINYDLRMLSEATNLPVDFLQNIEAYK